VAALVRHVSTYSLFKFIIWCHRGEVKSDVYNCLAFKHLIDYYYCDQSYFFQAPQLLLSYNCIFYLLNSDIVDTILCCCDELCCLFLWLNCNVALLSFMLCMIVELHFKLIYAF